MGNKIIFTNCLLGSAILVFSSFVFAQTSGGASEAESVETVPGEFLIKMKSNKGSSSAQMERVFGRIHSKVHLKRSFKSIRLHHLYLGTEQSEAETLKELRADPDVEYAEPNYVVRIPRNLEVNGLSAAIDSEITASGTTSETYYKQSKAPTDVERSWPLMYGTKTVVVAVLDTGLEYTHPVIKKTNSIWINPSEIAGNGIDDDGNGYVDDVYGWDFVSNTNNPMDDNGHGTHVSGIVLGLEQDILSSTLAISNIRIMPLKFLNSQGSGSVASAVSAIYYAVANGAKVINNSWGGSGYSQSLKDALVYAYNKGITVVSAAGNESSNIDQYPTYPASYILPGHVVVAATDDYDTLANFSSYGSKAVTLTAPGVHIKSTYLGSAFAYMSGTSMATPFVTGLAAQISREAPQLTGYQVKEILIRTVDVANTLRPYASTGGRANALKAVQEANASTGTKAFQPAYIDRTVASNDGNSTGGGGGCGTITSTAALENDFWSSGGGSGGFGPLGVGLSIAFFLLPLIVWGVTRKRALKRLAHSS